MANNGNWNNQYRGLGEWQDESQPVDQAHSCKAIYRQQSQLELPLPYSPHPIFHEAAQMARSAYAGKLRAQQNMRAAPRQQDTYASVNANANAHPGSNTQRGGVAWNQPAFAPADSFGGSPRHTFQHQEHYQYQQPARQSPVQYQQQQMHQPQFRPQPLHEATQHQRLEREQQESRDDKGEVDWYQRLQKLEQEKQQFGERQRDDLRYIQQNGLFFHSSVAEPGLRPTQSQRHQQGEQQRPQQPEQMQPREGAHQLNNQPRYQEEMQRQHYWGSPQSQSQSQQHIVNSSPIMRDRQPSRSPLNQDIRTNSANPPAKNLQQRIWQRLSRPQKDMSPDIPTGNPSPAAFVQSLEPAQPSPQIQASVSAEMASIRPADRQILIPDQTPSETAQDVSSLGQSRSSASKFTPEPVSSAKPGIHELVSRNGPSPSASQRLETRPAPAMGTLPIPAMTSMKGPLFPQQNAQMGSSSRTKSPPPPIPPTNMQTQTPAPNSPMANYASSYPSVVLVDSESSKPKSTPKPTNAAAFTTQPPHTLQANPLDRLQAPRAVPLASSHVTKPSQPPLSQTPSSASIPTAVSTPNPQIFSPATQSWKPAQDGPSQQRIDSPLSEQAPSKARRLNDGTKQQVSKQPASGARDFKAEEFIRNSSSQSHLSLRSDMIQQLEHTDALKRDEYDPATIARDVLINCGKHPTEPPLNYHLDLLRWKFPSVDGSKDLTTFRWDLVEEAQARLSPVKRPKRDPITAPAPPIIGAQVPPAPAPAPAPVPVPVSAPVPIGPPTASSVSIPATTPLVDLRSPTVNKHNSLGESQLPFPPPTYHSRPNLALSPSPPKLPLGLSPPHQEAPHASIHSSPSHLSLPPATTSKSKSTLAKPEPSKPKSKRAKNTPQSQSPKTFSQPQVVVPPSPVKMAPPKKRGRPKKNAQPTIQPPAPAVQYPVFRCHWEDCQSELHNLKALESHVCQKHIPFSVVCKWKGCKDEDPKAAVVMWEHAQQAHLGPVAWEFGDGPKVPITGEKKDIPTFEVLLPPSRL